MNFYTNFFRSGNAVLLREIRNGCRSKNKHYPKCNLYVLSPDGGDYKSIAGQSLAELHFDTFKEANDYTKNYKSVANYPIFGFPRYQYVFIDDMYPSEGIGIPNDQSLINVVFIDIETESGGDKGFPNVELANHAINAITMGYRGKTITFGLEDVDIDVDKNRYVYCETEQSLLENFLSWWKKIDPDIVTGWNVAGFDMPYIVNRMSSILEEKTLTLSPWKIVNHREVYEKGQLRKLVEIAGVAILDYIDLYKKFKLKMQESYKLDYIAYVELGEKKIDYSEYGSLRDLYTQDYAQFIRYNIHDVVLVQRLEEQLGYISLAITIAYLTKCNYEDVFHSSRLWDAMIAAFLIKQKICVPATNNSDSSEGYEGAYVKPPISGKFDWVVSFDLTSLYPSLIRSFNISPDVDVSDEKCFYGHDLLPNTPVITPDLVMTRPEIIDRLTPILKEKNLSMCANGTLYRRDKKSFLAELMGLFFDERKKTKKEMLEQRKLYEQTGDQKHSILSSQLDAKQNAIKIILNSLYGSLGMAHFRHYCYGEATAITLTGQVVIQTVSNHLNEYLNRITGIEKDRVLMNDTDSCYLDFTDFVAKFLPNRSESEIVSTLSSVCETKFQTQIALALEQLTTRLNAFENHLDMKREAIGQAIIVAKKRYALRVHDSEGVTYATPKIKITGLEAVRSEVPEFCRTELKTAIGLIFVGGQDAVLNHIEKTTADFRKLPLAEMSTPRGAHEIEKFISDKTWIKGTPSHIKGAIVYNNLLDKYNLRHKYETIKQGEKVRVVKLKTPNPTGSDVICFPTVLPEEFNLKKYVDIDGMFDKTFMEPIKRVLTTIGWKHDRSVKISDFFT